MDPYPFVVAAQSLIGAAQIAIVIFVLVILFRSYGLLKRIAENTDPANAPGARGTARDDAPAAPPADSPS